MTKQIVFVHEAASVRDGLARIQLAVHGTGNVDTHRMLAAAAYRVAAQLEQYAGAEGFSYSVSASKARLGVVEFSYVLGASTLDGQVAEELAIEACADCGYWPADALVEMGEIDPGADDDAPDGPWHGTPAQG